MSSTKKPKEKRLKPPKTEEQAYIEEEVKKKSLKGVFLVTPAVNYLGRGSYLYSSKVDWDEVKRKVKLKKDKK